jgi:MazG family protein
VTFSEAEGMVKNAGINRYAERASPPAGPSWVLRAGLRLGFGGFGRNRLIDLQIGHLQLAEEVQEHVVLFGREISFGLIVQGVKHVDEFVRRIGVDHRLASARVGIRAKNHGGVAPQHADEVLEGREALGSLRWRWSRCGFSCLDGWGWSLRGLPFGFPLFFLDDFLAQFAFGGKGAPVDYAKCFLLFMVFVFGQCASSAISIICSLSRVACGRRGGAVGLWVCIACQSYGGTVKWDAWFRTEIVEKEMPTRQKRTKKAKKPRRNSKPAKQRQLTPGQWFEKLVAVQARLRAPNGCPWDREQTHQSLRTYLIEEAYEVLEALESGNDAKFAEEMGDLLLQIVFHSQIAREEGRFTVAEVIREIHDKMIRRHPHVFGKTRAKDSAEVLRNWEQIKAQERRLSHKKNDSKTGDEATKETSLLDGVSRALPATLEGFQLTRKASRIGFDWEDSGGVFEKIQEEAEELKKALREQDHPKMEEELGDLLFAAVNLSRFLKIDPEIALKKANAKFSRRFRAMETMARKNGRKFKDLPREEMEAFWEAAKGTEGKRGLPEMSAAPMKQ